MKLITRDTDYAVRALRFIADNGKEVITASQLVEELEIPRPFLRKILQRLNKAGVLISQRGKGGGFILAKPARQIYLVDLMQIFQGDICLNECLFKKLLCPDVKKCHLKKKIDWIEKYVLKQLKYITLASLLERR